MLKWAAIFLVIALIAALFGFTGIASAAAGITKFKTKKRLAELRLEHARQNLARINDIFDEVTRQMNSLKRQAAKAERYAEFADELVRSKVDIFLAAAPEAVRYFQKAAPQIPIVLALSTDPVGNGFAASLAHPGGQHHRLGEFAR